MDSPNRTDFGKSPSSCPVWTRLAMVTGRGETSRQTRTMPAVANGRARNSFKLPPAAISHGNNNGKLVCLAPKANATASTESQRSPRDCVSPARAAPDPPPPVRILPRSCHCRLNRLESRNTSRRTRTTSTTMPLAAALRAAAKSLKISPGNIR